MSTPSSGAACWVCGGALRAFWHNAAFESDECRRCGHIVAAHAPLSGTEQTDYHLTYEQNDFVAALAATRRRQAGRILEALGALAPTPRSLFDFGCGRGWLLEVARERGLVDVAGGDVSALALDLLRQRGMPALELDTEQPFEKLELGRLPFVPQVITLLDVVEHFPGDIGARLARWLEALPDGVLYVGIKVPVRDGLLFSIADLARRAGAVGPGQQLFQIGTYPPHYQYFSRRSLDALIAKLGLQTVSALDDLDFEPEQLGRRLTSKGRAVRRLAAPLGQLLGGVARRAQRADSRIVIARRPR